MVSSVSVIVSHQYILVSVFFLHIMTNVQILLSIYSSIVYQILIPSFYSPIHFVFDTFKEIILLLYIKVKIKKIDKNKNF